MLARIVPALAPLMIAAAAFAQAEGGGGAAEPVQSTTLWGLFRQSFDMFSVLLIAGSITAGAVIARCILDIRASNVLPPRSVETINGLLAAGRLVELREFIRTDRSFPAIVLRAAFPQLRPHEPDAGRAAMREAGELAASEASAGWFRRIEPLNIIGNLGPLIGLAGTVWGMILAFTELGVTGGQARPADLSLGISKALFHTLLGLCLAFPCLLVFGYYRAVVDRLCTRAMVVSAEMVEKLADRGEAQPAAARKLA